MGTEVKRVGNKVLMVPVFFDESTQTRSLLCSSDQHYDSIDCDKLMLKRHYDKAKIENVPIAIFGDFFDAMQGRSDKRSSKSALDPKLLRSSYINGLIEQATDFLTPYAHNIISWSSGNHETSILKYAEVDLLELTIQRIRENTGVTIPQMPYTGWLLLQVYLKEKHINTIKLAYTHGSGGGGAVTKGTIIASRRANFLPDADIVISGHIHESWLMEIQRERVSERGKIGQETQWHLSMPSYKDEYGNEGDGWWHETGKSPRPKGAWMLDLSIAYSNRASRAVVQPRRLSN